MVTPPVPLAGLGTMDPSRFQARGPLVPPARVFVPPQRPPHSVSGYCPSGHPGAYSLGPLSAEAYCPVCGLPGEWTPTPRCPHVETEPRGKDWACAVCGEVFRHDR